MCNRTEEEINKSNENYLILFFINSLLSNCWESARDNGFPNGKIVKRAKHAGFHLILINGPKMIILENVGKS